MADFASATTTWGSESTTLLELMKLLSGIADSSQDVTLSMYLEIAGVAAEGYTDSILLHRNVVQQVAKPRSPVRLNHRTYTALVSVVLDGDTVTSDYEVFQEDGISYLTSSRSGITRSGTFKQMTITYTAGFSPLPTDLAYAIVRTAMTYEDSDFSGAARRETVVGVGTIEYGSGGQGSVVLPPTATTVLDRYRNWSA
jgi:hypothetical protein